MPATDGVRQRLAVLRRRRGSAGDVCLAVRDLVVVCSSSRGGSSMFGELLRRSPDLLTFSAEINPHVTIPTLGSDGSCDVVADPAPWAGHGEGLDVLRDELGNDIGRPAAVVDPAAFADHVAWRLTMQWPSESVDPDRVAEWVRAAMEQPGADPVHDRREFLLRVLPTVIAAHPCVNPYRYDLDDDVVRHAFPDCPVPQGPTTEPVVEMAPFVLPRVWRRATATEAAATTVVVTTPRNAFRLPLLAATFPNARLRVVHLTRNPAAAVNGLRDGWRHRGFFSAPSDVPLDIAGYTDEFPAWGSRWWNYDVPPAWREWSDRPLVEVCAFQWRAAHQATLAAAGAMGAEVHRIAFEDVTAAPQRRWQVMSRLCEWLGVDPLPVVGNDALPVVMPTAPPRRRRWADNPAALEPVLEDRATLDLAAELGYPRDPAGWA